MIQGITTQKNSFARVSNEMLLVFTVLVLSAPITVFNGMLLSSVKALGESEWRLRQLTTNGGETASISGDGSRVAFISNPNDVYSTAVKALAVINTDGTGFKELVTTMCYYPSINLDGSRIAFNTYSEGIWQLAVINSNGTGFKSLTSVGRNIFPCISGDGSKIVFVGDSGICVINSDGTGLKELTHNLPISYDGYSTAPSISENGSKIVFSTYNNTSGASDLYIVNSDGTGLRRIIEGSFPQISYDGSKIGFADVRYGGCL